MNTLKYILLIFLSFSLSHTYAQYTLGLKGGYTYAWPEYGPDAGLPEGAQTDVRGMNISVMAYYSLGKYLSLGIEPGFVERGASCIPGFGAFVDDTKFFLDYVEAPLMLSGQLPLLKQKLTLFGKVGYGAALLARGIQEVTPFNDEPVTRSKIPLGKTSRLNRWDHGTYGAVGIGVNMGKTQLFLESQYFRGMRDADRNNISKNRSITVNFGLSRSLP